MGESPIIEPASKGRQSCRPASKKPLKRGSSATQCGGWLDPTNFGFDTRGATLLLNPTSKLGPDYTTEPTQGQSTLQQQEDPHVAGLLENWYREGDSNPYTLWAQPPQGCVSTNSTTSAILRLKPFLLLLLSWRHVSRWSSRLLLLKHRDIVRSRLLLWNFQYRWIWETYLSQLVSLLFSKVT